jgi:hypothetical protein
VALAAEAGELSAGRLDGPPGRIALAAALAVGVVVRVALLSAKPFWRDEAWVVLLLDDPAGAVAGGRPVPLGFLWATAPARALPLPLELSLRWLPLCAGLVFLPVLARLAAALGAGATTSVAAVWLAAGLPALVYYSRELKPYGLDALAAAVVPLLALRGFGGSRPARRTLIAALALLPWLTFGALFPVLAVLAWGWAARWRGLPPDARRGWALATTAFGASALAAWALAWRGQVAAPGLRRFWTSWLLAGSDLSAAQKLLAGAERYLALTLSYLFPRPLALLALALAVVGAVTWPAPHRRLLLWLHLGTAAFCVLAAATDHYLLAEGRLLLFAAPTLLLWVAQGFATVGRWTRAGALVLVLPIAASLWWSQEALVHRARATSTDPTTYFRLDVLHDVDVLVARAAELIPAGAPVLVSRYSAYAFQVYAHGRIGQAAYCEVYCFDEEGFVRGWLTGVRDSGWVILTDEESAPLRAYLEGAGFTVVPRATARGAHLWQITRLPPP